MHRPHGVLGIRVIVIRVIFSGPIVIIVIVFVDILGVFIGPGSVLMVGFDRLVGILLVRVCVLVCLLYFDQLISG